MKMKKLFSVAKEKLGSFKQDDPFNLTMLTVDTHFEDGYVCESAQYIWNNQVCKCYGMLE